MYQGCINDVSQPHPRLSHTEGGGGEGQEDGPDPGRIVSSPSPGVRTCMTGMTGIMFTLVVTDDSIPANS